MRLYISKTNSNYTHFIHHSQGSMLLQRSYFYWILLDLSNTSLSFLPPPPHPAKVLFEFRYYVFHCGKELKLSLIFNRFSVQAVLAMDVLINLKQGTRDLYNMLGPLYICSGFKNKTSEQKGKSQMAVMVELLVLTSMNNNN